MKEKRTLSFSLNQFAYQVAPCEIITPNLERALLHLLVQLLGLNLSEIDSFALYSIWFGFFSHLLHSLVRNVKSVQISRTYHISAVPSCVPWLSSTRKPHAQSKVRLKPYRDHLT